MTVIGAPTEWVDLIDQMVPEVIELVIAAWEGLSAPDPTATEDHITNALWRALVQNRDARRLPFQIRTQVVELDPAEGADFGRMDIAFIPLVPREDIYFCLECKRLNALKDGRFRVYASEYVRLGMLRFVTGQYSKAVRHGGMMAYVVDGNVPHAIRNIEFNVRRHHSILGMVAPGRLLPSTVLSGDSRLRESHHQRAHHSAIFRIHHLFVAQSAYHILSETN